MMNNSELEKIIESLNPLTKVFHYCLSKDAFDENEGEVFREWIVCIELVFSNSKVFIHVNEQEDTLEISEQSPTEKELIKIDCSSLYAQYMEKTLNFYWVANNNRGYLDICALSFMGGVPNLVFSSTSEIHVLDCIERGIR